VTSAGFFARQSYPQTVIDIALCEPSAQYIGTAFVEHRGPNTTHPVDPKPIVTTNTTRMKRFIARMQRKGFAIARRDRNVRISRNFGF
jgi:hypothetical protein